MSAVLELTGQGKATLCQASASHSPTPVRFVWHHVQPQEAGGQTIPDNLIQLCDSCHYTIHRLLWIMRQQYLIGTLDPAQTELLAHPPRRQQLYYAIQGFDACRTAGTVTQIPNEG